VSAVPRRCTVAALERLAQADARSGEPPWRTLAPDRTHARPLLAIGRVLLEPETWRLPEATAEPEAAAAAEAFAEGLVAIAEAMRRAFPHNIFGDLDHLAASLWRGAAAAPEGPVAHLREQCRRVVELQELFGQGTAIRFRYVHDFLYGFDWAKWVARDPATRARVGPFAPQFLESMEARGHELLALIASGRDLRYPPLPDARPRNPFGFSREPADELVLHRHLAREGLLPVEAWRVDASPRWDRPFQRLRREHAARLGLADHAAPEHGASERPA
jgi:hypothetical protein